MVGKKKWKADKDIDGLIKSVSNSEVENFRYEVPTDEELDSLGFPNIVVNPPTLKYLNRLSQNATVTGEWAAEWLRLLICKEDELGVGFLTLSEEEQKMQRHQMAEEFRKSTRSLNWKKYKYALEKVAASSWDEKWDDEWSEEEDSGGEEGESEGVEASGCVVGSKEEAISVGEEIASANVTVNELEMWEEGTDGGEEGESEGVEASGCVVGSKEEAISVGKEITSASVTVNELEMWEEGTEKLSKYLVGGDIIEKMNMNVEEIGGMPDRPAVSHNMFSFHCYEDNDNVKEYTQPFSLEDWLVSHAIPALRYLPYQSNKEDWSVENWSGDRLKRESLGIIHSVLSSVMDYHENNGSNGNIQDHKNILLHQHVVDFGGSKRILYKVKLPEPIIESDKSSDLLGLAEDMRQVKLILKKFFKAERLVKK